MRKMGCILRLFMLLIVFLPGFSEAQSSLENYTLLPLKDLSSFENSSGNWSVKGVVAAHPLKAGAVTSGAGEGILLGIGGAPIKVKTELQDLKLKLEFMLSPGAEGAIILPGGHRLLIADSWQQSGASDKSCGYITEFPTQNVCKAPGLWQTLELAFDAATKGGNKSARLNYLTINGVVVQQGVFLPLKKSADPTGLLLEVGKGSIAFRSIAYQKLGDKKPVSLSNLTYKLYTDPWDSKSLSKVDHEKSSPVLTQEVGGGLREFHLVYEGDVNVAESAKYYFTAIYTGPAFSLDIDGKNVLTTEESYEQSHTAPVVLEKGVHKFKLRYSKYPWRKPILGLRVEKSEVRPYDLHALSSLPESPNADPYLAVEPIIGTELVRSFIQMEGEKNKRTHCLSVGSLEGRHYTLDLNRGALLQVWRGGFANVTEMWYERGEPQLLEPEGAKVVVSGKSSIAPLQDRTTVWPDSSNITFVGYRRDEKGAPTIRYSFADTGVTDQFVSGKDGLERRITLEKQTGTPYYVLLAVGQKIVKIEKGLFQIDNGYYLNVDKKVEVLERTQDGKQELLVPIKSSLTYSLFW